MKGAPNELGAPCGRCEDMVVKRQRVENSTSIIHQREIGLDVRSSTRGRLRYIFEEEQCQWYAKSVHSIESSHSGHFAGGPKKVADFTALSVPALWSFEI